MKCEQTRQDRFQETELNKRKPMKNIFFILFFLTHSFFLQATTGSQDNTNPPHKNSINFYGTLVTHQGNTFKVENISIENRHKQIPMYDRPDDKNLPSTTENKETGKKEIILTDDPHEYTVTDIDLDETAEIQAIQEPLFVFKQPQHRPVTF